MTTAQVWREAIGYAGKVSYNSYGRFASLGDVEGVAVWLVTASPFAEGSAAQTWLRRQVASYKP